MLAAPTQDSECLQALCTDEGCCLERTGCKANGGLYLEITRLQLSNCSALHMLLQRLRKLKCSPLIHNDVASLTLSKTINRASVGCTAWLAFLQAKYDISVQLMPLSSIA